MDLSIKDYVGRKFNLAFAFTIRTNGYNNWKIELKLYAIHLFYNGSSVDTYNGLNFYITTNKANIIDKLYTSNNNIDRQKYLIDNFFEDFEEQIKDFLMEEYPRYIIINKYGDIIGKKNFKSELEEFDRKDIIDTFKI